MLITTRGRYALRFMIDLAEHQREHGYITTLELAERQQVSHKYAERLMASLSRSKFVKAAHGKEGGYRLSNPPEDYRVSDILSAMNENLAPVECMKCEPNTCPRAGQCKTLPMWKKLGKVINDFFDGITLADLM